MRLTEDEIRKLTLSAIEELGENATPEKVRKIVKSTADKLEHRTDSPPKEDSSSGRIIITSFGLNTTGVVAAITKALSDAECDIQDISQKLMGEYFTMIMIVDITGSPKDFKAVQEELVKVADDLKIKIYTQHEDIFRQMHRI